MKLFCNCKEEKQEILKTFESTILKVVESMEKTQNKFVDMAAKIEMAHFKQVEKLNDKHARLFEKTTDKFLKIMEERPKIEKSILQELEEKVSRLSPEETNSIEKEEDNENPLSDFPNMPMKEGVNLQFEGEEEIYPIEIT